MSGPDRTAAAGSTIPIRGMRRVIGRTMLRGWQEIPHVSMRLEVDLSSAQEDLTARYGTDQRPSLFDLIIQATARSLREFPPLNAYVTDTELVLHPAVNIGVAVAVEGGILVPVIPATDQLELRQLAAARRALQTQALETGRLETFTQPSFTISNLGLTGIDSFAPIVAPGQTGALGIGRITSRPYVVDSELTVRLTAVLTLSFDHRALDGDPAARFLAGVGRQLEPGS